jgi:hypothetical protein
VVSDSRITSTSTSAPAGFRTKRAPIFSATRTNAIANLKATGGTTTSTIGYGPIAAPTPGGIGTASVTVVAIASGGSKNGTADTSDVIVTIING